MHHPATSLGHAHRAEAEVMGAAYRASGYVVVDQLGQPLRPEAHSDAFTKPARQAGVPVIRLHDARHTSVTLKRSQGWPDHLVALWHGHDESVMRATYTHSCLDDLRLHAEQEPPPGPPSGATARGARDTSVTRRPL